MLGRSIPKSEEVAFQLYCKAAAQNHPEALYEVGGVALVHNIPNSRPAEVFARAAVQGHAGAKFMLAQCLEKGEGCAVQSNHKALGLYTEAAKQEHYGSTVRLYGCYAFGDLGTSKDSMKAAHLLVNIASSRNVPPSVVMAYLKWHHAQHLFYDRDYPL